MDYDNTVAAVQFFCSSGVVSMGTIAWRWEQLSTSDNFNTSAVILLCVYLYHQALVMNWEVFKTTYLKTT